MQGGGPHARVHCFRGGGGGGVAGGGAGVPFPAHEGPPDHGASGCRRLPLRQQCYPHMISNVTSSLVFYALVITLLVYLNSAQHFLCILV